MNAKRLTWCVMSIMLWMAGVQMAFAGWTDITPANSINTLYAVWGTSPTNIYAVGFNGVILHYDGTTWTTETSNTQNTLYAVWGSSETNIYAVGDSSIAHKTASGTTWGSDQLVDYKNPGTDWSQYILYAIRGTDANHVYTGTQNGSVFYFDGTGWTEHYDYGIMSVKISGIWPFTSTNIYVSTASGYGQILRYDGNTWTDTYDGDEQTNLYSIWGNSPSDIYASGNAGLIIHCSDPNGASWLGVTSNATQNLNSIFGSSDTNIIAVGSQGTIVHNKGNGFSAENFNTIKDLFGVWVSPDGSVAYAVGSDGLILKWVPDPITTTTTVSGNTTTTIPSGGTTTVPGGTTTTTVPGGTTTTIPSGVTTSIVPPGEVGADFIGNPLTGRMPLQVQFTNLSGGDIASYQWTFGDGGASTEKNPSHVYQKRGTYSVILTVIGTNSKTATKTRENYISVKSRCAILSSLDNNTQIESLRAVRDASLDDLAGVLLTAIYYRNTGEVSAVLEENPTLRNRFKQLVTDNSAVVENLLQGQPASVSPAAVADVIGYLEDLKAESSIMLQYDIDFVIMGIRSGFLLDGLGITIQ